MAGCIYDIVEKEIDGKKIKIIIRQVTPDLIEPVIEHMCNNFLMREPMCCHANLTDEAVSVESMCSLWRTCMEDGAAIVAILDEGAGTDIIGANVTYISKKDDIMKESSGEKFKKVIGAVNEITDEADIWEKCGVDAYLSAVGLSVDIKYNGLNLGADILMCREKLCEKFGLSLTATVFTSPASQHLAAKVGFETILEQPYSEFNFSMSDMFRDLEGSVKVMIKKYN